MTKLTGLQIADAGLDGWVYLLGGLQTRIHTRDFATGLSVVNAIGAAAEEMTHHPDLNLRYTHVDARLTSHDEHGVTDRDIRLARTISSIAASAGVQLESAAPRPIRRPADRLVPDLWQRGTPSALALGRVGGSRTGPAPHRRCTRRWRHPGQRRGGAELLGARRH